MHEQTRSDRDQYINVNYSNINSNWTYQYNTYDAQGSSGSEIGAFDFNSIMLYRSYASEASIGGNGTPQMTRKDGSTWNDNYSLSQGDIEGVKYLYDPKIYLKVTAIYNENESYSNISMTNEDVREVYDVYVDFYSNSQFTTPLSLTTPLEIKIMSNGVVSKVKIASGQSSVYLGQSLDEYSTEYGKYRYHNTISLGVVKGVGYILSY